MVRRLAIRFQSLLRRRDEKKLEPWFTDAKGCGIPMVMNFARTLIVDIQAVRNAVIERGEVGFEHTSGCSPRARPHEE